MWALRWFKIGGGSQSYKRARREKAKKPSSADQVNSVEVAHVHTAAWPSMSFSGRGLITICCDAALLNLDALLTWQRNASNIQIWPGHKMRSL